MKTNSFFKFLLLIVCFIFAKITIAQSNTATTSFAHGQRSFDILLKKHFRKYASELPFSTGGKIYISIDKKGNVLSVRQDTLPNNEHSMLYTKLLAKHFALNKQWLPSRDANGKKTGTSIIVFVIIGNGSIRYEIDEYQKELGRRFVYNRTIICPKTK